MSRFLFHIIYHYWREEKENVWAPGFVLNVNSCRTNRLNNVKWRTEENRKVSFIWIDF